MPTYITLANFTDQGMRSIKESPDRVGAFRRLAEDFGLKVKNLFYTMGNHDVVVITEGSDEALTAALISLGSLGNVRTQTMRAFSTEEMREIINRMP